jgi:hypothetical protein
MKTIIIGVGAWLLGIVILANIAFAMSGRTVRAQGPSPEARIAALEQQVAAQEQFLKENTQSPHWAVPMSVADDEEMGPAGRHMLNRVMTGR